MTLPAVRGVWSYFLSLTFAVATAALACAQEELPPEIDSDGVQTLTRGPVHEAFASPVADPKPGLIVKKAPPADIREQPPEFQPEGQNVQWYPGYWAWDEDRDDYIWISGAWRDPPPGKRWVPGYWAILPDGFQWVSGFWIDEAVEEVEYLKPPPESLEQGPVAAAPADNYFYIPGTWTFVNGDYVWVAGYYAPYREDWVYVQPHWVWTPRGYIFVAGYWDWRLPRRGQIFAPAVITPVVYARPTYYYTPRCVISTSNLFVHLWVRDSYCHYYFGNYYGPTYAHRHFTPWCNYSAQPRCYDPLFTYCNVHYHRQGINYSQRMQSWHTHYVNHTHERPPITWRDQIDRQRHDHDTVHRPGIQNQHHASYLGQDLKDVIRTPEKTWKRQDLAAKEHNRVSIEQTKQLHQVRLDQERLSHVTRDLPGRGDSRGDGRADGDRISGDRNDRPNRGPNIGDKPNVPDLVLPGNRPGVDNPADKLTGNLHSPNKVKLPRSAVTALSSHNSKINVPDAPEKTAVSRPVGGDVLDRPLDKPREREPFDKPQGREPRDLTGERNPFTKPGNRTNVGPNVPSLNPPGVNPPAINPPENGVGGNPLGGNLVDQPRRNDTPRVDGPRNDVLNPLTSRDPGDVNKPNLNPKPLDMKPQDLTPQGSKPHSSTSSLQQKIDALRQQQQDAINKARNRGNDVSPAPNLGGNPNPNPNPVRTETPRVQTPKFEVPKVETPKRDLTPRSLGGGQQPKVDLVPRNPTPAVQPRSLTPTPTPMQPPRLSKPAVERPSLPKPSVQPQVVPRHTPARPTPAPKHEPKGKEKKPH